MWRLELWRINGVAQDLRQQGGWAMGSVALGDI
jgi:hypothetical protein